MQFYVFSYECTAILTNYIAFLGFKKSLCSLSQGRHRDRGLLEERVKATGDGRKQNYFRREDLWDTFSVILLLQY